MAELLSVAVESVVVALVLLAGELARSKDCSRLPTHDVVNGDVGGIFGGHPSIPGSIPCGVRPCKLSVHVGGVCIGPLPAVMLAQSIFVVGLRTDSRLVSQPG